MARRSLLLLLSAQQLLGCASVISGTSQRVGISLDGADAKAVVDGTEIRGSGSVQLPRGRSYTVRAERPGFEPVHRTIAPTMNGWVWGNLLLGPLFPIGVLVDALSGAVSNLAPRDVTIAFDRATPAAREPPKERRAIESPRPVAPPEPAAAAPPSPRVLPDPRPQWTVAVMEMEALRQEEPSQGDLLRALTEQTRIFMAEKGLRVVDRGAQEAALRRLLDEAQKESYRSCYDASCQIPLGKALAASHLLRSSLARFGGTCALNGELIDLAREVSVGAGVVRTTCGEEALLDGAERLASLILESLRAEH